MKRFSTNDKCANVFQGGNVQNEFQISLNTLQ